MSKYKDRQNISETAADKDSNDISLLTLALMLLRGWKTIVLLAALGLILALLYIRYVSPTYEADALIQIEEENSQGVSALASISQPTGTIQPTLTQAQTESELIKSRMVLEPVIELLQLTIQLSDPEVGHLDRLLNDRINTQINTVDGVSLKTEDGSAQIISFDAPLAYLGKKFTLVRTKTGFELSYEDKKDSSKDLSFKGRLNQPNSFATPDGNIEIMVADLPADNHPIEITRQILKSTTDSISKALSVAEVGRLTGIIEVSLKGADQEQVSLILREIVKSYLDQNQSRGSEEITKTLQFMETQIPVLRAKLETSEAAYNEFREQSGTIDVAKEAELLVTENYQIDAQLNELKLQKAELTTYYTEEHPLVIQINDQLRTLNARKNEIAQNVERLPEVQREFLKLAEDANINKEIYLTLLKNYEQLKIVEAGQIGFARVIDFPSSNFKPIAPRKLVILLLGIVLGGMLGTMLVLLKGLLRNVIRDPKSIEAKMGVPVIATIPRSKSLKGLSNGKRNTNPLLSYADHNSLSYEAIKGLRTFLMSGLSQGAVNQLGKVIVLTAESPEVGKSFICANLAEVFAQLDKKILIIDADMHLGSLHKTFNVEQPAGLADYFSPDNTNIASITHPTSIDNLDLIPCGEKVSNPSSLLASDKFGELMAELKSHYDYILINTPPVLAATDAIILSQHADQVLMVTKHNDSLEGQLAYAIKQMNKANVKVDGIVLNDVQQGMLDKNNYNYAYTYGHSK